MQVQSAPIRERVVAILTREPVGRSSDGKQAAGCDGSYSERAVGCYGSDVKQMNWLRSCYVRRKRRQRFFVLFAEFDLYSKFVSES